MSKIEKRLLNLAVGEFSALCVFFYVFTTLNLGMASLIAFSYLIIILLQGSLYWFYRFILLINRKSFSLNAKKTLNVLRYLNIILVAVISILIPINKSNNDLTPIK